MAFLVRSMMSHPPTTVEPETSLLHAAELLRTRRIRHLPVVDRAHHLVGILSQRDLVAVGLIGPRNEAVVHDDRRVVGDIMKRTLHVVRPSDPVAKAGAMMLNNTYDCLPVVDGARVVGIVTSSDFVRLVLDNIDRFGGENEPRWRD